jgi:hypothetical protein
LFLMSYFAVLSSPSPSLHAMELLLALEIASRVLLALDHQTNMLDMVPVDLAQATTRTSHMLPVMDFHAAWTRSVSPLPLLERKSSQIWIDSNTTKFTSSFLFLFSALTQLWLARHHQREKRYGPSPKNNYTSGSGGSWFKRRRAAKAGKTTAHKDAELGAVGGAGLAAHHLQHADAVRTSHETGYTGTTAGGTYTGEKYENTHAPAQPAIPTNGGYYTGPTGTSVNPYGYDNTARPATNY